MARLALLLLLVSCGAPAAPAGPAGSDVATPADPTTRVRPAGSRLSFELPTRLVRVRHALRWRGEGLDVRVADAQVSPGEERTIAEEYLAQLSARHEGELTHRPASVGAARGYEATLGGPSARVRTIVVWREGAISRLTVVADAGAAADAERVIDSLRFDRDAAIDPARALELRAEVPEGLGVIPVTNEQLLLRPVGDAGTTAHALGFPSADPVVDIAVLPYPDGNLPTSDLARGQLLGSRFAGLELGTPRMTALAGPVTGFAIVTTSVVEGTELSLYGAYLEGPDAVVLIRASVAAEEAERWLPRFGQLTLSVELDR